MQERTLSSWQSSTNNPMQLLSSYEKKEGVQIFLCKTVVCWLHGSKAKPHVSSLKTYGSSSISEAAQVRLDFLQKKSEIGHPHTVNKCTHKDVCISAIFYPILSSYFFLPASRFSQASCRLAVACLNLGCV